MTKFLPLIISTLSLSVSGVASALTCENLFQQADTGISWSTHEAMTAKEIGKGLGQFGLHGPASAPGVIIAAMYVKSVAQDLQSEGRMAEAVDMFRSAGNMNDWAIRFTDGRLNIVANNRLNLPTFHSTHVRRVVERSKALMDKASEVEKGPKNVPALIVAVGIAKMNAEKLQSKGQSTEALEILEKVKTAEALLSKWFSEWYEGA